MVGKLRRLSSCSLLKLPFWGIPHVRTHLRVGQHVGDTSLCPSIWVCPKIWLCGYTMMYTPRIAIILTRKKKKKHLEKKNEKKKHLEFGKFPTCSDVAIVPCQATDEKDVHLTEPWWPCRVSRNLPVRFSRGDSHSFFSEKNGCWRGAPGCEKPHDSL